MAFINFNLTKENEMKSEIRAWIVSIKETIRKAHAMNFISKGSYTFEDWIYHPKDYLYNLNHEFIRARVYTNSNWNDLQPGSVILVHKLRASGETIKRHELFSITEADHLLRDSHQRHFSISRTGEEFQINDDRIFIEDIESLKPTIEVISNSKERTLEILDIFNHQGIIYDSVPQLIYKSKVTLRI